MFEVKKAKLLNQNYIVNGTSINTHLGFALPFVKYKITTKNPFNQQQQVRACAKALKVS
jgi:hypothetical protein